MVANHSKTRLFQKEANTAAEVLFRACTSSILPYFPYNDRCDPTYLLLNFPISVFHNIIIT